MSTAARVDVLGCCAKRILGQRRSITVGLPADEILRRQMELNRLEAERAAIAELIKSNQEYDVAREALKKRPESILGGPEAYRYKSALARRTAALACVLPQSEPPV